MNTVSRAAIIAGGASRRMGQPKALLGLGGETLIARTAKILAMLFEDVLIVTDDKAIAAATPLPSLTDVFPGKGPLGGIHAALSHFEEPTFCIACDLPFLSPPAIEYLCRLLANHDAVLPRVGGRCEPLHAVYAPSFLPVLEKELQSERVRRTAEVLAPLDVRYAEEKELSFLDNELKFLANINTPEDARAAGFSV